MELETVKSYVDQYITPLIKYMPTTVSFAHEAVIDGERIIVANNHEIINGVDLKGKFSSDYEIPDGSDILTNIKSTMETIMCILATHKHVAHRSGPDIDQIVNYGKVRMRLITE